jgi:hypothetical protein
MNRVTAIVRKLAIASCAATLGMGIGIAGAHGMARLLNPGDCLVEDGAFTSSNGGCTDNASGLTYSASRFDMTGSVGIGYSGATAYCDGLVEGGQSDWRVPTLDEMQGLSTHGGGNHLNISGPNSLGRWTSTKRGSTQAYAIVIGTNQVFLNGLNSGWDVVCVRPQVFSKKGK